MKSYMSNGTQQARINHYNTSKPLRNTYGVPQGSILGPILSIKNDNEAI